MPLLSVRWLPRWKSWGRFARCITPSRAVSMTPRPFGWRDYGRWRVGNRSPRFVYQSRQWARLWSYRSDGLNRRFQWVALIRANRLQPVATGIMDSDTSPSPARAPTSWAHAGGVAGHKSAERQDGSDRWVACERKGHRLIG